MDRFEPGERGSAGGGLAIDPEVGGGKGSRRLLPRPYGCGECNVRKETRGDEVKDKKDAKLAGGK